MYISISVIVFMIWNMDVRVKCRFVCLYIARRSSVLTLKFLGSKVSSNTKSKKKLQQQSVVPQSVTYR